MCQKDAMHHRERLQRPRAYNEPKQAHELTFSCYHRFPFLSKERTCQWLAAAVHQARRKLAYSLWAYVFMPDHVHVIVYPRNHVYDTSEFLKQVKETVSREAIAFLKNESPTWLQHIRATRGNKVEHHFWQPGRGFDRNINKAATLRKMIDYIHENPVRMGLVSDARLWKWSSAGWFAGTLLNSLEPDPIPFDWLEE
jgi:putative transposase